MKKSLFPTMSSWNYRSLWFGRLTLRKLANRNKVPEWYTEPAEVLVEGPKGRCVEGSLAAFLVAIFLTACGENTTTEKIVEVAAGGTEIVESVKDLPKCTKENEGGLALVKGESSVRVCVDGKWFATVSKDTSSADFSCTTKELNDKSGLKIICNGDSIGVVLNGAAGKDGAKGDQGDTGADGKNGKDGVGCSIVNQTDSSATIKCGNSTMTLNFKVGGASVDTTAGDTLELDSEKIAISLDSLSGYSQKGPFLKGSTVLLYELSDGRTLKQMGNSFTSRIEYDDGRYKFSSRNLVSQYALIEVEGKYRNEVTGYNTNSNIKLQAYTNMLMRKSANVNLLTHLEKDRVYYLVTKEKKTVRAAKRQAQAEILSAFHIDASNFKTESEDLNVFGKSDADAALLAISILLQRSFNETVLSVLLTEMSIDLEEDGSWDDASKKAEISDWAATVDDAGELAEIRSHVEKWKLGDVPDFEKFVHRFWSEELGLGVCGSDSAPEGTVKRVTNSRSNYYAQSYKDTSSAGRKVRFICVDAESARWRKATDLEKDRFGWNPKNTKKGALLDGPVTRRKMVWDADTLRYADSLEIYLNKGCVSYLSSPSDTLGLHSSYTCTSDGWEFDSVNVITDPRDNQVYNTIKIGGQYWMAENLNYEVENSFCYKNEPDSCAKYGRLYTWAAAHGKSEEECGYGKNCYNVILSSGVCPEGWHLPSGEEWKTLYSVMGESPSAMQARGFESWTDATDDYGFSALPGGRFYSSTYNLVGQYAQFWCFGQQSETYGGYWQLRANSAGIQGLYSKSNGNSVRCLKD